MNLLNFHKNSTVGHHAQLREKSHTMAPRYKTQSMELNHVIGIVKPSIWNRACVIAMSIPRNECFNNIRGDQAC